jgi:hypothetical protein
VWVRRMEPWLRSAPHSDWMLQTALAATLRVAVLAVGLIRVGRVVSVRRIIGTAISYSASSFTRTRWRTRGHSGRQN